MTRAVRIETSNESPKALIFGLGSFVDPLAGQLAQKGCTVRVEKNQIEDLGSYEYIFLSDPNDVVPAQSHLHALGKMLVIIKDPTQKVEEGHHGLKIVAVGDPNVWDPQALGASLVKAMFSSSKGVVDLREKIVKITENPSTALRTGPSNKLRASIEHKTYNNVTAAGQVPISPLPQTEPSSPTRSHIPIQRVRTYNVKAMLLVSFFLLSLLGILGVSMGLFARSIISDARALQSSLSSAQWGEARTKIDSLQKKVGGARAVYEKTTNIAFPLKKINTVSTIGMTLASVDESLTALDETLVAFSSLASTQGVSLSQGLSVAQITAMKERLADLSSSLAKTKEHLDGVQIPLVETTDVSKTLAATLLTIEKAQQLFPFYELFFSKKGITRYLVLFQNNMELRPTGGFIGSYAVVEVESGRMKELRISDVYGADGQLKGHVDPPDPIRKYLSQPNWFLRDSNFDPDFAVSARQAMWFLEKETGQKVDGVIGVNLFVLQTLLSAVGPVPLSDFGGEVVSAENFFVRANELIHSGFFEGSNQKKDFLTAVSGAIQQSLNRLQGSQAISLLSTLTDMLEQKDILIFLSDPTLQTRAEQLGWAGRVTNVSCLEVNVGCYPDYLSIVEANLGVNKANYYVNKSVALEKHIETTGSLSTTVTLSYENKSVATLNQGGPYVNYVRLLVPAGAAVQSVSLNNSPLSVADVDVTSYGLDKTSIGFLLKVAAENKGVVRVRYVLPRQLGTGIDSFQFFYQKQGGDKTSPLVFSLTYPKEFTLSPTNFTAHSQKEGELLYSTDTSVDRVFMLKIRTNSQ